MEERDKLIKLLLEFLKEIDEMWTVKVLAKEQGLLKLLEEMENGN
jgi:hypothetical protein